MSSTKDLSEFSSQIDKLNIIRGRIYSYVSSPEVEYCLSGEPVNKTLRLSLKYKKILPNQEWGGIFDCAWFHVKGNVPDSLRKKHIVLHIDIGAEGLVFRPNEDEPFASITTSTNFVDAYSAPVAKSIIEIDGDDVDYYIDAGFNGKYKDPDSKGVFNYCRLETENREVRNYYYDYLTCMAMLPALDKKRQTEVQDILNTSFELFDRNLLLAEQKLKVLLNGKCDDSFTVYSVGHSHLDLAWLWPERETKRKACRTFMHQINNLDRYKDYVYGASQPWQFEVLKQECPSLFGRLKELSKQGRFECQGAMYVEADTNLPSGESLIRQILYGKKFFKEEFGEDMKICWLPDVFGYSGNLPQILRKSDVPYFLTIKLSWNEHNRFPYRSFVWEGIDSSQVLVHMPCNDNYNSDGSPAMALFSKENDTEKDIFPASMELFGLGDGGGGAGEVHLEMINREKNLDGFPKVIQSRAVDFFDKIMVPYLSKLPHFCGELYLEKHQGTYTTQADNKKYNRLCEFALIDTEVLWAYAHAGGFGYPKEELDEIWKRILFLQFHDILPGSSIKRVYDESRSDYRKIYERLLKLQKDAIGKLGNGKEKMVFNPTSYEVVDYIKTDGCWYTAGVQPWGFGNLSKCKESFDVKAKDYSLENDLIKVHFSKSGAVDSLIDKKTGYEYAKGLLNQLCLYEDIKLDYNAWDIWWKYYEDKKCEELKAEKLEFYTDGPEAICMATYKTDKSTIVQKTIIRQGDMKLTFSTFVDWNEDLKMLRSLSYPGVFSDNVRCDIQMGSIMRSANNQNSIEKAQFEICAHKYVDVSDEKRGISLINNCKYGHRVKEGLVSLCLLRSTEYPDPSADRHKHEFSYALFPHEGTFDERVIKQAYIFNKPLKICFFDRELTVAKVSNPEIVIETIKMAEDGKGYVIRMYESLGKCCRTGLECAIRYKKAYECNLLEKTDREVDLRTLDFSPYEIKTVLLRENDD